MNYDEAKKKFIKTIQSYEYKYRTWEVYTDFCHMAAISLYQPFKRSEDLEKQYMDIVGKYNKEEVSIFPKLLNLVVEGLSSKFGDFLGECFMELNLGSKYKGQFFTPYEVSKFMAQILGDNVKDIETLSEPACGSSGMVIARAEALYLQNINYQNIMRVQAVDVDALCVSMSYIQLTLLHIPAEIIHGNTLSQEVFSTWYTPAYIIKAADIQVPNWRENEDHEELKIKVPNDPIENKAIYTDDQLEVFAAGKLFA